MCFLKLRTFFYVSAVQLPVVLRSSLASCHYSNLINYPSHICSSRRKKNDLIINPGILIAFRSHFFVFSKLEQCTGLWHFDKCRLVPMVNTLWSAIAGCSLTMDLGCAFITGTTQMDVFQTVHSKDLSLYQWC